MILINKNMKAKRQSSLEYINPGSTKGISKAIRISPIVVNFIIIGLAIWAIYESFQSNYFSNTNPGSKILSIATVANAVVSLYSLFALGRKYRLKSVMTPYYLISSAVLFLDIVYLLNVWKITGVLYTKESDSALTFIKYWSIGILVGSLIEIAISSS